MKILLVSSFLPYPLFSGGQVRLYNLLKQLQNKHEVTLICEIRSNQTTDDVKEVEKVCKKVLTIPRKKQWSLQNILHTGFSAQPFLLTGHRLEHMQEIIEKELTNETYDLIHVETFYVMQNLPKTSLPIVLVEHNIEYFIYERFTKKAPVFLRPLLQLDVKKLQHSEESYWKKAKIVVAVSKNEQDIINAVNKQTAVVPNGVDLTKFTVKSEKFTVKKATKKILYIGDFKYIQNQDAAKVLIEKIFPEIVKKDDSVALWIVGRHMPESLKSWASERVILDDNSPLSTPEIFQQADVLLAPIHVGGGTSYKIIEAMSSGTPVVTTTLGNEGINAKDSEEILLGETNEELATITLQVLQQEGMYERIASKARVLIEKNFSWEMIGEQLNEVYTNVAKEP